MSMLPGHSSTLVRFPDEVLVHTLLFSGWSFEKDMFRSIDSMINTSYSK
jgi:hypothetical protein